ncbi:MAG: dihydrolipoyllysine-residue succinyltransferase [Pseudomonadota bacterium]|nr:dihydrolipoyllysine-residue succinyltransferase [Pseudomonadota bacterium]
MIDILVPQLPESVSDATVAKWLKTSGDDVRENDVILELETDKIMLEITARASGKLTILKTEGSRVKTDEIVGQINQDDTIESRSISNDAKHTSERISTKHLDVQNQPEFDDRQSQLSPSKRREQHQDQVKSEPQTSTDIMSASSISTNTTKRVPMSPIRRTIAQRLIDAQHNTASITTFNEVDMSQIIQTRKLYGDEFLKMHDTKLGMMGFFIKAACEAMDAYPEINAYIEGDDIIYNQDCHVGIAVATDAGLVVPVIKYANKKSLAELESALVSHATKARNRQLSVSDLQGGTFSITNGGVFGSMLSTPILNTPQSAILGLHNITDRAVVVDGTIVIRPMMFLALTYDHRIIDGKQAVSYLMSIKKSLDDPRRFLLDL